MTTRPLTHLPRDLYRLTGANVSYRNGYTAAIDGRIPAEQGLNGRWSYRQEDLPVIASAFGLTVRQPGTASSAIAA